MTAILETQGLSRAFNGFHAVSNVSLQVQQGHIHALIGPNDSGKSSVLQAIKELSTLSSIGRHTVLPGYDRWIWRRDPDRVITWEVVDLEKNGHLKLTVNHNQINGTYYVDKKVADFLPKSLRTNSPYKFHPDALRKMTPSEPFPDLNADGSNLGFIPQPHGQQSQA